VYERNLPIAKLGAERRKKKERGGDKENRLIYAGKKKREGERRRRRATGLSRAVHEFFFTISEKVLP